MSTNESENKAVLRQWVTALGQDREAAEEALADEVMFNGEVRDAESWMGRLWDTDYQVFPDWTETVEEIIAEDDWVAARWQLTATHTGGEILGIPPTGNEFESTGNTLARIEDGEIVEVWTEWDAESLYRELDIYPESIYEMKIRRQLLQVLLRVLRHNLRNDLGLVKGLTEMIGSEDVSAAEYADRIRETIDSLLATAEKAYELEQNVVNVGQTEELVLPEVIGTVLADRRQEHPDAEISITLETDDLAITSNRSILSVVIDEAIENAVLHTEASDPRVEVAVGPAKLDEYAIRVTIADNGPGIPDTELAPLRRERESPLEHASGLGLWAMKWGTEQVGGEIEFNDNEPEGTVVKLSLPDMA